MATGIGQARHSFSIILYVTAQKSDCGKSKASRAIADSGRMTATRKESACQIYSQPGMYGPPLCRKRIVKMSRVGLRKCIRPSLE
jgi:hypothetical protein